MPTLSYCDVDGVDRSVELGGIPVVVGRNPDCAIRSEDPRVSRYHARFYSQSGAVFVEDLGSANGVWVGPQRISVAPLPIGELVVCGSLLARVVDPRIQPQAQPGAHAQLWEWLMMERKSRGGIEAERDAFARRVGEISAELARAREEAGALRARVGEVEQTRTAGAEQRVAAAEQRAAAAEQRAAALERATAGAGSASDQRAAGAEQRAAAAEQRVSLLERAMAQAEQRIAAAEGRAGAAEQRAAGAGAGADERATTAERALAAAEQRIAALTERSAAAERDAEAAARRARDAEDRAAAATTTSTPTTGGADGARIADLEGELERIKRRLVENDAELDELDRLRVETQRVEARAADEERRRRELEAELAAVRAAPPPPTPAAAAPAGLPAGFGDQIAALGDSMAALRSSLRAISDETAVMEQNDSVQLVSSAVGSATEEIERARDALRALAALK